MTPDEVLISLYGDRAEAEREAIRRYQLGLGPPYTEALAEIDKQIEQITKRIGQKTSSFLGSYETDKSQTDSLSAADRKKLCVLEKLKETADLMPEAIKETRIDHRKYDNWTSECGIEDNYEMRNIMHLFQENGLIEHFDIYRPYV